MLLQSVEVRRILEVQAVELACARRTVEDIRVLDGVLVRSKDAIEQGRSIASMDYEFHMAIFRSTQNAVFVRMVMPFYLMSRGRREAFFADLEPADGAGEPRGADYGGRHGGLSKAKPEPMPQWDRRFRK